MGKYIKINFSKVYSQTRQIIDSLLEEAKSHGQVRSYPPKYTSALILEIYEGITLQMMADTKIANPEDLGESVTDIIISRI